MHKIIVTNFLDSPVLLSAEKGERLLQKMKELIDSETTNKYTEKMKAQASDLLYAQAPIIDYKNKIQIDFEGYKFLSTTFLNNAFGQLCLDLNWDINDFHENIEIKNLKEDDLEDLEAALFNAQQRRKLIEKKIDPDKFYASLYP